MSDEERTREVANEAAFERRYSDELMEAERVRRDQYIRVVTPNKFTANLPAEPVSGGQLIGRIKLGHTSDVVGADDFYIGTAHFKGGEFEVFPWTAPVAARTFYRKPRTEHSSKGIDELCDDAVGVRAFVHLVDRIHDLEDEWLDGREDMSPMFSARALAVPRPPSRPAPPVISEELAHPEAEAILAPIGNETTDDQSGEQDDTTSVAASSIPTPRPSRRRVAPDKVPGPPLRTAGLLQRQLAAPKESSMSTVLATLQPDQYESITALATEDQILQGHPGTGKTIIAVHRAAYLLSEPEPDEPDNARARGRVLVVGPTDEYVGHVSSALRKLIPDGGRFNAVSLPSLLEDLAGLPRTSTPTETTSYLDVDLGLAELVDKASTRAMSNDNGRPDAAAVYSALIGFLKDPPEGVLEPEWAAYLRSMPKAYGDLKRDRRRAHRPLLAYLGVKTTDAPRYGHIVVDEAQDIHPLEWEVLARIENAGGWTILGDLNQRRTDHTFSSWHDVAERLAIDTDGRAPVQILERGYRSTAQIIQFANQLLPKEERVLYSLQREGVAPTVRRAQDAASLLAAGLAAADELDALDSRGTTAIIAADYEGMRALMPRAGWQADRGDSTTWLKGDRTLRVLPSERARGLEFDAVVVVEPAAFPELFGRKGVLYTALTRANRLLTVVHYRALPEQLRQRTR